MVLQMIDSLQKLKIINFTFYITIYLVKKKLGTTCVKGSIHSSYQLKTIETLLTAFSSKIYNYLACLNSLLY